VSFQSALFAPAHQNRLTLVYREAVVTGNMPAKRTGLFAVHMGKPSAGQATDMQMVFPAGIVLIVSRISRAGRRVAPQCSFLAKPDDRTVYGGLAYLHAAAAKVDIHLFRGKAAPMPLHKKSLNGLFFPCFIFPSFRHFESPKMKLKIVFIL